MPQPRDAFELKLTEEQSKALALFLCDELQMGLDARSGTDRDTEYWWMLYEQARTRTGRNAPWPDAADLTSYLGAEKVDALHARIMRTVFGADPIWTVEGWGDAADKAPFVEEFHQWKAEEDRLAGVVDKLVLCALVEPRGLLEVYEGTEMRVTRKRVMAKVVTDPATGALLYDEEMNLQCEMGPDGKYVEPGPQDIAEEKVVDERARVRTGPVERVIPYRDSVILPCQARDKEEIWAYGKRVVRRYADLERKAKAGMYDLEAVERMTETGDQEASLALQRAGGSVAPQENKATAEKELWELLVLLDINAFFKAKTLKPIRGAKDAYDGARWYLTTLHLPSQQMLRVQHDDMEQSRFVPMILFPRPDRCTEGFSFVGHKLITTIEEHTAVRNMRADRSAMAVQAPIKRLQGALWDPIDQPWGPKAVIDVRDMKELDVMTVPDVTAPLVQWEQSIERTAERLAGVNDIASGQVSQESRTLGEVNMATEQSFVRMDLIVRRCQEAMEDLATIRHAILKRAAAERQGFEAPAAMVANLEGRGASIDAYMPDGKVTAELLEGAFRFKPNGSVDTADPSKRMALFVQWIQMLPTLMQAFPLPTMNPLQMNRAIWREACRVFKIENTQAFIGSPAQDVMQPQNPMLQMLLGGMGGAPSMLGASPPQMPAMPGMMPPQQGMPPGMPMAPSTNTIQ